MIAIPSTFLIDRNGVLRAIHQGGISEQQLEEYLSKLSP
jgi:peroxiredoxin